MHRPSKKTELIWGNFGIQSLGRGSLSQTNVDLLDLTISSTLKRTDKSADQFFRLHFDYPQTKVNDDFFLE